MPKSTTGNMPAFARPFSSSSADKTDYEWGQDGMTYHQWLVGMALSSGVTPFEAVARADQVVLMLDKRQPEEKS